MSVTDSTKLQETSAALDRAHEESAGKWSQRKTITFVVISNLVLWAAIAQLIIWIV